MARDENPQQDAFDELLGGVFSEPETPSEKQLTTTEPAAFVQSAPTRSPGAEAPTVEEAPLVAESLADGEEVTATLAAQEDEPIFASRRERREWEKSRTSKTSAAKNSIAKPLSSEAMKTDKVAEVAAPTVLTSVKKVKASATAETVKADSVKSSELVSTDTSATQAVAVVKPGTETGTYAWSKSAVEQKQDQRKPKHLSKQAVKRRIERAVRVAPSTGPSPQIVAKRRKASIGRTITSFAALSAISVFLVASAIPNLGATAQASNGGVYGAEISYRSLAPTETQEVSVQPEVLTALADGRDDYSSLSWREIWAERWAAIRGSYRYNDTSPIRWPFPYTVPLTSFYGMRVLCNGCAPSFHAALDFGAARGTPIQSIAAGTVVSLDQPRGGYGTHVVVYHGKIDGVETWSLYAHMITNSFAVQLGQRVEVGDYLGLVGNTGYSFGNHLHLEIRTHANTVNNRIDPYEWLNTYAG